MFLSTMCFLKVVLFEPSWCPLQFVLLRTFHHHHQQQQQPIFIHLARLLLDILKCVGEILMYHKVKSTTCCIRKVVDVVFWAPSGIMRKLMVDRWRCERCDRAGKSLPAHLYINCLYMHINVSTSSAKL